MDTSDLIDQEAAVVGGEWSAEYFRCGQCGFFLKPYDGDAALAHIKMHHAENANKLKGEA